MVLVGTRWLYPEFAVAEYPIVAMVARKASTSLQWGVSRRVIRYAATRKPVRFNSVGRKISEEWRVTWKGTRNTTFKRCRTSTNHDESLKQIERSIIATNRYRFGLIGIESLTPWVQWRPTYRSGLSSSNLMTLTFLRVSSRHHLSSNI